MKKVRFILPVMLVVIVFFCMASGASAAPFQNSKDLHKAHENNAAGSPIYNNQIVSVEGIVTVPTGVWHDNANYFSIVTEKDSYRFAGGIAVFSPGESLPQLAIGDKVIVTGRLSNDGYSSDSGTTVIVPQSSEDIIKIGSGYSLPDAFPLYTDPEYEEVEKDLGYRFEGMPVRILGIVHAYDNEGTLRGFWVDGSRDGCYTDGLGAMNVKVYDYSQIDISGISEGDWVVVEGVLFQSDTSSPYTSGYYIRPTKQGDIKKILPSTEILLSEAMRKDANGVPVLLGKDITVRGIATVASGVWNSASNAFTVVTPTPEPGLDPVYPEGALYVYNAGIMQPVIDIGDEVTISGVVSVNGYDMGMPAIIPNTMSIISNDNAALREKMIRSDVGYSELASIEGMPVKMQGRVYNLDNTGVTRGFSIDASSDHNWTDKNGMISVKFYDYSGIDISNLSEGDLVTLRGVLQKNDSEAPYTSGYFLRPRNQGDIVKRSDHQRRTVYIHLDAFRNDYVGRPGWDTSNLDALISTGTRCTNSYGEYVSMTTANMTTLVTGAHTATHNVPALAFYDKATDRRVRNLQNYDVATIGEVFQDAGLITASVKQRKLQNRGADYMLDGGTITQTRDDEINLIMNEDPDLLVVLFNETDSVAHKNGTDSVEIKETVEAVDDAIGSIIAALDEKGVLDNTNIVIASDHGMSNVNVNLTQQLNAALQSTGIPFENAVVDIGPFGRDTKVIYNLSSGAAQIYMRQPLTVSEEAQLLEALSGIDGVASVYSREQLDMMNTPDNLGDWVVDCAPGYAFSTSAAEHGSQAQQQTFLLFSGPGIQQNLQYMQSCMNVDIVPTLYYLNNLPIPSTVDGEVLYDILVG